MAKYKIEKIGDNEFSFYCAVYSMDNIFLSYDWSERLADINPNDGGYMLLKDGLPIGGAILRGNHITYPFLVSPFCDKYEFWSELLKICSLQEKKIYLDFIPDSHREVLGKIGAQRNRGQFRMIRPTSKSQIMLEPAFYFDVLKDVDKEEIVSVVYQAHLHGYTSTVTGPPDVNEVADALERRYRAFAETDTLGFSTIIKNRDTDKIAAVCVTGIYPDSPNHFSTIHQVSVLPEYRRRGLAQAMILNSINLAHEKSPVITLGVMDGNPAKELYSKLGFAAGCGYSDYILEYSK